MKEIVCLVLILIKDCMKMNDQDGFSILISCLVLEIFVICDVIYSHIRNEIYRTKNNVAGKIHSIFTWICSYTTLRDGPLFFWRGGDGKFLKKLFANTKKCK